MLYSSDIQVEMHQGLSSVEPMGEIKSAQSKETRQIRNKLKDKSKLKEQSVGIHEFLFITCVGSGAPEG